MLNKYLSDSFIDVRFKNGLHTEDGRAFGPASASCGVVYNFSNFFEGAIK